MTTLETIYVSTSIGLLAGYWICYLIVRPYFRKQDELIVELENWNRTAVVQLSEAETNQEVLQAELNELKMVFADHCETHHCRRFISDDEPIFEDVEI